MSDWADIVDQGAGIIIERFAYFADANPNYLSGTDLEQRKTSYAFLNVPRVGLRSQYLITILIRF